MLKDALTPQARHHFTWKHLQRYLDEFEVRWNMAGMAGQEIVYEGSGLFRESAI